MSNTATKGHCLNRMKDYLGTAQKYHEVSDTNLRMLGSYLDTDEYGRMRQLLAEYQHLLGEIVVLGCTAINRVRAAS